MTRPEEPRIFWYIGRELILSDIENHYICFIIDSFDIESLMRVEQK